LKAFAAQDISLQHVIMVPVLLALCGCMLAHAQLDIPDWDEVTAQDENVSAVEKLDVLDASSWAIPDRVVRCPVHEPAALNVAAGHVEMDTVFNESMMYSLVEGMLPAAAAGADLEKYDGLEMHFFNTKVSHFKVRLNDARQDVRFIAAVKVDNDGEHNLWLKWSDFHGEELMMGGIKPCSETSECRTIRPGSISSIAVLLPISNVESPANFRVTALTLDVLTSGGGNATNSTQLRPASDAELISFETTTGPSGMGPSSMVSFALGSSLSGLISGLLFLSV
ncbi:unnamed protein product, partial [Effrenium voratum]